MMNYQVKRKVSQTKATMDASVPLMAWMDATGCTRFHAAHARKILPHEVHANGNLECRLPSIPMLSDSSNDAGMAFL